MILAVMFSIALVLFVVWTFRRSYLRARDERIAWFERDRQIRRNRGEDV